MIDKSNPKYMSMGVSIIIPVYNAENLINICILSVVKQTYQNLEILLINDGSTDSTGKICREWVKKDSRIVFYDNLRKGLGKTRNWAVEHATKEYITFLDADDWIHKQYVEELVNSIIRNQSDIAICDINYINRVTGNIKECKIRFPQERVCVAEDYSVINKSRLFAWGKLYKRTLFEGEYLYPDWNFEDVALTPMLVYKANIISRVPRTLYNYYTNQANSLSYDSQNIKDLGKSLQLLLERASKSGDENLINIEMKKIVAGQLRFAQNRWGGIAEKKVREDLAELETIAVSYYPLLIENLHKIFAVDNLIIKKAIGLVIADKERLVPLKAKFADYYFLFESEETREQGQQMTIPDTYKKIQDEEMRCWEIAEYIIINL